MAVDLLNNFYDRPAFPAVTPPFDNQETDKETAHVCQPGDTLAAEIEELEDEPDNKKYKGRNIHESEKEEDEYQATHPGLGIENQIGAHHS